MLIQYYLFPYSDIFWYSIIAISLLVKKTILLVATIFGSYLCNAQLDHYWSWNFNTSSALVSGAVVGGQPDVSSIFYNPALISRTTESQLAVNASLFTLEWMNHKNIFGDGLNAKKSDLRLQPRFISFTKDTRNNSKLEFAYFMKNSDKINQLFNYHSSIDILSLPEGQESYNGEIYLRHEYTERWFGLGFSNQVSPVFSYGISTFAAYKDLRYQFGQNIIAFPQSDSVIINGNLSPSYVASFLDTQQIKSWEGRILWKGGLHWLLKNWGIGLTFTTPSIYLIGNSGNSKQYTVVNIFDASNNQPLQDSAFISHQSKEIFKLKDPFSISLGFEFNNPNNENSLLFSAEYFNEIGSYRYTNANSNNTYPAYQSGNVPEEEGNLYYGTNSVLNFAVGYHYFINENISAMGGFRTDFSSMKEFREKSDLKTFNILSYDIYHVTFGGDFSIKQFDFVAGLQYSFSREKNQLQIINFSDPIEYIPSTGEALQGIRSDTMDINYNSLSLFIGLTYNFLTGKAVTN